MTRLALGLDLSTQSLTAVIADIDSRSVIHERILNYRHDPRLAPFGLDPGYILPPREDGEANQPAAMYLAALDALFDDLSQQLQDANLDTNNIAVINVSAQQHGHVLLNTRAEARFQQLTNAESPAQADLVSLLQDAFAVPFARIWKTSFTRELADSVRQVVGGKEAVIQLTGSDAPWRFSAFGIMKTALTCPEAYEQTQVIHPLSSLIPAVLVGNVAVPLDYGNACGTSLMNYLRKEWDSRMIWAVGRTLPGGAAGLESKLPALNSGVTLVGRLASYFVRKYAFNPRCAVGIGSGDNPQTKVLVSGSLLSLGSGFVNMVETDGHRLDLRGYTNAMYDALDRPFTFGCRANGALSWDKVRAFHKQEKHNYAQGELALRNTPAGNFGRQFLWHADPESFPLSGRFGPVRYGYDHPDFAADYVGIVESTLGSIYLNSKYFMAPGDRLYVAGGAASSDGVMRRIAGLWNRTVVPVQTGGAALGAAATGACAWMAVEGQQVDTGSFCASFLKAKPPVRPRREDVAAYHRENGFLARLADVETELVKDNPA